jgi:hypothetical protein
MEINHLNGESVDTDKLGDVDAILMEESYKLHTLFAKYNRQLFLIGEMNATKDTSSEEGCAFFHVDNKVSDDISVVAKTFNKFVGRIDRFLRTFTRGQLFISQNIVPPSESEK